MFFLSCLTELGERQGIFILHGGHQKYEVPHYEDSDDPHSVAKVEHLHVQTRAMAVIGFGHHNEPDKLHHMLKYNRESSDSLENDGIDSTKVEAHHPGPVEEGIELTR